MFESDIARSRFSVLLFIFQAFSAPLVALILGITVTATLERVFNGQGWENLIGYLVFSQLGFALGYAFQSLIPRAIESGGRLVWIPPVSLLTWGCIWDLAHFGRKEVLLTFWPSEGEGAWGLLLILPALACCFFSLGIVAAHRRKLPIPRPAPSQSPAAPESL